MLAYVPVGPPALIAFAIGGLVFFASLFAARRRGARAPKVADAQRDRRSITWIIVQGLGIGIVGFDPIAIRNGDWSVPALIAGLVVLVLMLGAVALFDASSRAMGANWALVARTRRDATLVTGGPFAYVRNPIYVALALFMLAMATAYGHPLQLLIGAPIFALGTWRRVASEEAVLRAQFGADYDDYAARVKRFVPGTL